MRTQPYPSDIFHKKRAEALLLDIGYDMKARAGVMRNTLASLERWQPSAFWMLGVQRLLWEMFKLQQRQPWTRE
ncbi:hypothetical protein [Paenibacillus pabuli]|uniref:hypothetical protein n=1 Tax=Paenibacillus pabuli TaxID=1472 RepID=UPI003CF0ED89